MRFGQLLLICTRISNMARLVLMSILLIVQMLSIDATSHKLNPPYPLPVTGHHQNFRRATGIQCDVEATNNKLNPRYPLSPKNHHQSFRRGASIQYDRFCNATGYGR